jgi:hypothetical protein
LNEKTHIVCVCSKEVEPIFTAVIFQSPLLSISFFVRFHLRTPFDYDRRVFVTLSNNIYVSFLRQQKNGVSVKFIKFIRREIRWVYNWYLISVYVGDFTVWLNRCSFLRVPLLKQCTKRIYDIGSNEYELSGTQKNGLSFE